MAANRLSSAAPSDQAHIAAGIRRRLQNHAGIAGVQGEALRNRSREGVAGWIAERQRLQSQLGNDLPGAGYIGRAGE
jgi:hypothetical protein